MMCRLSSENSNSSHLLQLCLYTLTFCCVQGDSMNAKLLFNCPNPNPNSCLSRENLLPFTDLKSFRFNSRNFWSISIILAPVEPGMNAPQSQYNLLTCLLDDIITVRIDILLYAGWFYECNATLQLLCCPCSSSGHQPSDKQSSTNDTSISRVAVVHLAVAETTAVWSTQAPCHINVDVDHCNGSDVHCTDVRHRDRPRSKSMLSLLLRTELYTVFHKKELFYFRFNSRNFWSISIILAPVETGMNTPPSHIIYLLNCLMNSKQWQFAHHDIFFL